MSGGTACARLSCQSCSHACMHACVSQSSAAGCCCSWWLYSTECLHISTHKRTCTRPGAVTSSIGRSRIEGLAVPGLAGAGRQQGSLRTGWAQAAAAALQPPSAPTAPGRQALPAALHPAPGLYVSGHIGSHRAALPLGGWHRLRPAACQAGSRGGVQAQSLTAATSASRRQRCTARLGHAPGA